MMKTDWVNDLSAQNDSHANVKGNCLIHEYYLVMMALVVHDSTAGALPFLIPSHSSAYLHINTVDPSLTWQQQSQ